MSGVLGNINPGGSGAGGTAFGKIGQTATGLGNASGALTSMGIPQLQQAGGYFSSLASGNRAQATQALAPDIENINAVYGGTARTLSRFLRGPTKDVQLAESERERGGQVGSLFRNIRPQANTALATMGANNVGTGVSAGGTAGSLFGSQANLGQAADIASAQLSSQAGAGFGGLLFNLLKTFSGKG